MKIEELLNKIENELKLRNYSRKTFTQAKRAFGRVEMGIRGIIAETIDLADNFCQENIGKSVLLIERF